MSIISVVFAFDDIARIRKLMGFKSILDPIMSDVTSQNLVLLQQAVRDAMDWKSGDGTLSDSVSRRKLSAYSGRVGTNSPYGRRRNWGFSGMTDSLGRYFPNDPGAYFMEIGLMACQDQILENWTRAIDDSIAQITGGA